MEVIPWLSAVPAAEGSAGRINHGYTSPAVALLVELTVEEEDVDLRRSIVDSGESEFPPEDRMVG